MDHSKSAAVGALPEFKVKVIGIGGAGNNALDRLILDGGVTVEFLACNTDVQSLASSVATHKVQLGRNITRGLGAGGDPEVGFAAAEEALDELRSAVEGMPLVLICAGLGGGTGSGAAPLIVKLARESGSLVLVCATLPFSFEGKRRGRPAQEALASIQQHADAVVCFENDRMGELIPAESGIHEAFAGADQIISQCIRAIIDLVNRRGLIRLGFDDLLSALRNHDARCLFGHGNASGESRGTIALSQALKSPLMEGGALLNSAANILVNIVGGSDLTLSEVQAVMEDLAGHIDERTQLLFGAAVDPKLDGQLSVTLISSLSARSLNAEVTSARTSVSSAVIESLPPGAPAPKPGAVEVMRQMPPVPMVTAPVTPSGRSAVAGAPPVSTLASHAQTTDAQAVADAPSVEPVRAANRGRFEKSLPTISEEGENLDVPTFLRKNFKVR